VIPEIAHQRHNRPDRGRSDEMTAKKRPFTACGKLAPMFRNSSRQSSHMRYWPCLLSILFAIGCHNETGDLQPVQFDCGNPLIDAKTGALVMPKHTRGIQQQLPRGVASKDGCWAFTIRVASRNFLIICLTRFITFPGAFRVPTHVFG
jgi:hypothetical protein